MLLATATTLFFVPVMYSLLRNKPIEPVSAEDAGLLFEKDEPEYQMAMANKDGNGQEEPAHAQANGQK